MTAARLLRVRSRSSLLIDRLVQALWREDGDGQDPEVLLLLDGARDRSIQSLIRRSKLDHRCLFLGDLHPVLARAAPYLVQLGRRSPASRRLIEQVWGRNWGVFVRSPAILQDLRRHFRRFLQVRNEAGKRLLFRFYDPRVLAAYLPTCNRNELSYVFGPVDRFALEGESGSTLCELSLEQGELEQQSLQLSTELAAC